MDMPNDALPTEDQITQIVKNTQGSRIAAAARWGWHSRDAEMADLQGKFTDAQMEVYALQGQLVAAKNQVMDMPDYAKLTDHELWNNWYEGSGFKKQMETFPDDKLAERDHIVEQTRKMIIENDRGASDAAAEKAWHSRDAEVADLQDQVKELVETGEAFLQGLLDKGMETDMRFAFYDAIVKAHGNDRRP